MECLRCGSTNPAGSLRCEKCGERFEVAGATATSVGSDSRLTGAPGGASSGFTEGVATHALVLSPGVILAGRYEILDLLGEGGMGAVYKARDRELDRVVALKLIRPDLANRPEVLLRFKQELILARKVTHKNVIRIFDLGEADRIRFISMDYIDGQDLKTALKGKGKFTPEEAVEIMSQVCQALDAAHSEGVIHRDLKPQNIMVDRQGKVTVMDFGIARSMEMSGLTQTGALVGTPEYMSPEQAKGQKADARSDLFALGIIFYELLTGNTPYRADTALASMLKRTQERARPPIGQVPAIPRFVNDVVVKCLEINRELRYQSAAEILEDLERRQGSRRAGRRAATRLKAGVGSRKFVIAGATALLLAAMGWVAVRENVFKNVFSPRQTKLKPVTVLVADFANTTSEPLFDGALEPTFGIALEGASFITAYNRGQAHKIAEQLRPGATTLDEALARLVAEREGINVVVAGSIARQGDHYDISCKAVDGVTGSTVAMSEATAPNKDSVLRAASTLAARVRTALGDTTPESTQLAAAETFTTGSLEAAREYADAQSSLWTGKMDDAIKHYLKATQLDPNMGRAYTGLAVVYLDKKQPQEAKKYFELALSKIDRMSDREKFRTLGVYYAFLGNTDKAIEELTQLVQEYPNDSAGMANLALSYFFRRDIKRALESGRRAVEISPKNVIQRNNVGLYAMYAGDFDAAIREQQIVLQMNPSFALAYVGTALPQLALGQSAEAEQTYHRLEQLGPQGASQGAMGLADLALYEGRASEATQILKKGIAADLQNKNLDGAATKSATLGEAYLLQGKSALARAAADKAVASSNELGVLFWAARISLAAGQEPKALDLARKLAAKLEPDPQAYGKLIQGEGELKLGRAADALKLFQEARNSADTWLGRFDQGRAYLEAGAFAEADSEFEICLKRRGEVTALFLDEVPTYHLFPPVYYYLGRVQEGLKSPAAAESYKTFLAIKAKSTGDPLVADARRRVRSR